MAQSALEQLLNIMSALRDPADGCPWDKAQDFHSIVPFTLEEAYEVADAIEREAWDELPGELGDLLFQVVFYCQLAKERGMFDFDEVTRRICRKLTERHPHVFSDMSLSSSDEVRANWEQLKAGERAARQQFSVLDDIPRALPALTRAGKIQKRVAAVGFDWDNLNDVLAKVHEEIDEVMAEANAKERVTSRIEDEMGDLLFAVVNLSRHLGVEPEQALRRGNDKFSRRFSSVEQQARDSGREMTQHSLAELEAYWQQAKVAEQKN